MTYQSEQRVLHVVYRTRDGVHSLRELLARQSKGELLVVRAVQREFQLG